MSLVVGSKVPGNTGSCYEWTDRGTKQAIAYRGFHYDPKKLKDPDYILPTPIERSSQLRTMRFYIHFDPLHRTAAMRKSKMSKQRPAKAAAVVIGVTTDFHAFVMDYWTGDADLDGQASQLFRLYRMWCPALVSFEAVGAQAWLRTYIEANERGSPLWRNPISTDRLGRPIQLPRLSKRLVEDDKGVTSKEWLFREALAPWFHRGLLHLRLDQDELIYQLTNVTNEDVACDLVDCCAQGPPLWAPPIAESRHRTFMEARAAIESKLATAGEAASGWVKRTGYRAPWTGD